MTQGMARALAREVTATGMWHADVRHNLLTGAWSVQATGRRDTTRPRQAHLLRSWDEWVWLRCGLGPLGEIGDRGETA